MTKEELAERLNGREYGNEITVQEEKIAKESGLVAVFGGSDDLCEFRGAIYDEFGAYNGGEFAINEKGQIVPTEIEDRDEDVLDRYHVTDTVKRMIASAVMIRAKWSDGRGYSWVIETDIPHATFDILEDGEKFCRGIVFSMADLKAPAKAA